MRNFVKAALVVFTFVGAVLGLVPKVNVYAAEQTLTGEKPVNTVLTITTDGSMGPNGGLFSITLVSDDGYQFECVKVNIYDESDELFTFTITDENGYASMFLKDGAYTYDVEVPEGYSKLDEKVKFKMSNSSDLNKVQVLSPLKKNYELSEDSNLLEVSNLTAEEFDMMLEGTALEGIGEALELAEQESGVNGLYLLGLSALESGWGRSNYAKNRNNLVGWDADDGTDNAKYFDSKADCIAFTADKLKSNYLSEDGKYFEGYTPTDIDVHYCTDKTHAQKIVSIASRCVDKLKEKLEELEKVQKNKKELEEN